MAVASAPGEAETATRVESLPLVEVTGGRGRLGLQTLRELVVFREVYTAFVHRQIKVRYKQAALGIGWAVVQPVAASLLFSLFLGRLTHVPSEGVPYLVFAMSGMVLWNYFSTGVGGAMESIVTDQSLLRKVYFPREIFPFSSVSASLLDLTIALGVLIVFAAAAGLYPTLAWLALPVPILLALLAATALGTALSAVNVFYRDARYVLPFLLQLGLFATPVVYSLSSVPGRWRLVYVALNPIGAAIDALRRIVLHGDLPAAGTTLVGFAAALVGFVLAYTFFKRLERGFADRI